MQEIKKSSKIVFSGNVFNITVDSVLCPNGNVSTREVVHHNGGIAVIVIVEDKILLEKQFRYAINEIVYEIPAGKLEIDESPLEGIKRELEEETGYKATNLIDLGFIHTSFGYSNEKLYLYYCDSITEGKLNLDPDEVITFEFVEIKKFEEMINSNLITDSKTICAYLKYKLYNNKKEI